MNNFTPILLLVSMLASNSSALAPSFTTITRTSSNPSSLHSHTSFIGSRRQSAFSRTSTNNLVCLNADQQVENEAEEETEFKRRDDPIDTDDDDATSTSTSTTAKRKKTKTAKEMNSDITHTPLGNWEYIHGNYILRPSNIASSNMDSTTQPRALLHFLGGALVGAAPQVTYRYLLEKLASQNYLIVTTPYNLSFNHLNACDEVIDKFENIAPTLAREYGAIPVIGVGHSLGAVLQVLITSLFPDTPRAGNIIMGYNNKDVTNAIPFFEQVFIPFFVALANEIGVEEAKQEAESFISNNSDENGNIKKSGVEGLNLALRLARTVTQGEGTPNENLLNDIASFLTPPSSSPLSNTVATILNTFENPPSAVATPVKNALDAFFSPSISTLTNAGVLPIMDQLLDIIDQIPLLITEVADGARDFTPTPDSVATAARRAYRARRTLILQYENDSLDESEALEEYLTESERVMRMKRPMVNMDVQRKSLKNGIGGHATPVLAPPGLEVASKAEDVLGSENAAESLLYKDVDETVEEMVRWLEEVRL